MKAGFSKCVVHLTALIFWNGCAQTEIKKPISDLPDRSIQKSSSEKIQEGKVEQEKQEATTDVSGSKASKKTKSLKKNPTPSKPNSTLKDNKAILKAKASKPSDGSGPISNLHQAKADKKEIQNSDNIRQVKPMEPTKEPSLTEKTDVDGKSHSANHKNKLGVQPQKKNAIDSSKNVDAPKSDQLTIQEMNSEPNKQSDPKVSATIQMKQEEHAGVTESTLNSPSKFEINPEKRSQEIDSKSLSVGLNPSGGEKQNIELSAKDTPNLAFGTTGDKLSIQQKSKFKVGWGANEVGTPKKDRKKREPILKNQVSNSRYDALREFFRRSEDNQSGLNSSSSPKWDKARSWNQKRGGVDFEPEDKKGEENRFQEAFKWIQQKGR